MKIFQLAILWMAFSAAYTLSFWAPEYSRKYWHNLKDRLGADLNFSFTNNG